MTSSRFDPGLTSVRPQNPWTSPFYGSMNGLGLKTLPDKPNLISIWRTHLIKELIHSSNQLMRSMDLDVHQIWALLRLPWFIGIDFQHSEMNMGLVIWALAGALYWTLCGAWWVACKWTIVSTTTFLPLTFIFFLSFFFFFFEIQ